LAVVYGQNSRDSSNITIVVHPVAQDNKKRNKGRLNSQFLIQFKCHKIFQLLTKLQILIDILSIYVVNLFEKNAKQIGYALKYHTWIDIYCSAWSKPKLNTPTITTHPPQGTF
jgi:hypothetical protein